jgi:hypothetical protein
MIGIEDAPFTFEYTDYYKILPQIYEWSTDRKRIKDGFAVPEDFSYTSENNSVWYSKSDIRNWVHHNYTD